MGPIQVVVMDADKVAAVQGRPTLRKVRVVQGFLGLTGYYRQFIHDYDEIAKPITRCSHGRLFGGHPRQRLHLSISRRP